jgi:hypothetical protein
MMQVAERGGGVEARVSRHCKELSRVATSFGNLALGSPEW